MSLILIPFIAVLILVVIANLGQIFPWARWINYGLLFAGTGFVTASGLILLLAQSPLPASLATGLDPGRPAIGMWLSIGGGLSLVVIIAAILMTLVDRDPHIGILYWSRPVQLTAIVLAILYACANFAFVAMIDHAETLLGDGLQFSTMEIFAQNLGFVALAFAGVGWGIRRTWGETRTHLRLTAIGMPQLVAALFVTFFMLLFSGIGGFLIATLDPESVASASALNELILSNITNPTGAILLGLFTGIGEELLYRGALQPAFGYVMTSFLFAIHHVQYLNYAIFLIFALGLILGWVRNRWGTSTAALVHAMYNAILVLAALSAAQLPSPG